MEAKEKKFRLPKEFAEKWLAALRSGEYKQGKSLLCQTAHGATTYCCLGVAGAVCGYKDDMLYGKITILGDELPSVPQDLSSAPELRNLLIGFNDRDGKSFEEIADWIEQNVELYPQITPTNK